MALKEPAPHAEPSARRFEAADYMVGAVAVFALGFVCVFLGRSGLQLEPLLEKSVACGPWGDRSICFDTLGADEVVALATTYSIAWRRIATILVGTCVAVLGCLIVVLRIKSETKVAASGGTLRGNVATDSAGVFVCFLGVFVVAAAALLPMRAETEIRTPKFHDTGSQVNVQLDELPKPDSGDVAWEEARGSTGSTRAVSSTTGSDLPQTGEK